MSSNTGISPHATTFAHSYATATALGATDVKKSADAMSTHYLPNLISFTLGTTTTIASPSEAASGTLQHLQRLTKAGVGADIRLIRLAVKEVGGFAATVFITWELVVDGKTIAEAEKEGKKAKGWRWRNAYGYRRMTKEGEDGDEEVVKEGFEYVVSDEEVGELVKRVPRYFEM